MHSVSSFRHASLHPTTGTPTNLVKQVATCSQLQDHVQARYVIVCALFEMLLDAEEFEDVFVFENGMNLDLFAKCLPIRWVLRPNRL